MATPAAWAAAIAADAVVDGCDAALVQGEATHTRKAITMFDEDGNIVLQSAIDIRTNGARGGTNFDPNDLS